MSSRITIPSLLLVASLAFTSCDSKSTTQAEPTGAHESTTTVQIHPGIDSISPGYSLADQIAALSTEDTIKTAAEGGGLDAQTIKSSLLIKPIEGTDLVAITARHDHEETAQRIVQSVISAYIFTRNRQDFDRAQEALKVLDDELQRQEDAVREKRKALTVLIQQYGIPYSPGSSPVGMTEEEMHRRAHERLDELEESRDRLEIQIRKLIKTDPDDLIRVAGGLELPENQVGTLYQEYLQAVRNHDALIAEGFGPNHPEVKASNQVVAALRKDAEKEIVALKEVLNTRLNLVDRQVEKMREMVSEKKTDEVDLSLQQQYNVAKEEYEQARDLFREMKAHIQKQQALLRKPRFPLTIHD